MAQVIPRRDDFERGSPAPDFGSGLADWLGALPTTSVYVPGVLADFDGDGQPYATEISAGEGNPTGFQWRRLVPTEHKVEMRCVLSLTGNPFTIPSGRWVQQYGVLSRIVAGFSAGDLTEGQRRENLTCYAFVGRVNPTNTLPGQLPGTIAWKLIRYKLGVATDLATLGPIPLSPIPPYADIGIDFTKVNGVSLQVVNTGGLVVLTPLLSQVIANGAQIIDYPVPGANPFYLDTSADRITTQGRAGFVIGTDWEDEPFPGLVARGRHKLLSWQVTDYTGVGAGGAVGDVVVREEFKRTQPNAGKEKTDDDGATGPSCQWAYTGDLHALGDADPNVATLSGPSNNATFLGVTGESRRHLAVSRRAPDDLRSQTPQIVFDMTATGGAGPFDRRGAGVIAHGSGWRAFPGLPGSGAFSGYVAHAYYSTNNEGDWVMWLSRYTNGVETLLASGSGTLAGLSPIQQITLELEIGPLPNAPTLDGPVRMEVRAGIAGVSAQTLTLEPVPGVAQDGTYIIDGSADRITQGFEGFAGIADDVNVNIRVSTWDQGTLLDPGTPTSDLPNVALAGEADGATGSLNDVCRLTFPHVVASEFDVRVHTFDSGHTQYLSLDPDERRTWQNVSTFPVDEAGRDAIVDFWNAHDGSVIPFAFTDERDGVAYTARFVDGSLTIERLFFGVYVVRFSLEEVLS